jgi:ribosomal protein S25
MKVVDQVWEDLVARKHFATARQISKKLKIPYSSVKHILWGFSKRQVLDVVVRNKTNYYRIKE